MSEPVCIDLQQRFGRRYRIGWKADGTTKGEWPREDWPWLMELRCHHGKVYPWGGELLQAWTDKPRIGRQLRALPCIRSSRGDIETVVTFHVDHIEQVLPILKPYRRRQVSEAERERLRSLGFQRQAHESHCESDFPAVESTNGSRRGVGAGGSHAL